MLPIPPIVEAYEVARRKPVYSLSDDFLSTILSSVFSILLSSEHFEFITVIDIFSFDTLFSLLTASSTIKKDVQWSYV